MTDNKCVIYTRVSSIEQYIENYSIETQVAFCLRKAKELGYADNQIQFRGGVAESSKDIDVRKIYKEMVNYVCDPRNKVKTLIVYSTDRFSRHLESAVTDIARMTKKGVTLYTVVENYSTSTFEGIADINAKINEAQRFIGRLSQRTKAGIQFGLENGKYPYASVPRGYTKIKIDKKHINLEVNEEGLLIREAFKLLIQGYSISQITEKMKSCNLDIKLKRWGEIFRNPVYAGIIVCKENNKEYKGRFETIISELEFKKVQKILSNKAKPRVKHTEGLELLPLKSLVKCMCGSKMTGYVKWNKVNTPSYYICSNEYCRMNISSKSINESFNILLGEIQIKTEFQDLLSTQFQSLYDEIYCVETLKLSKIKQGIALKEHQLDKLMDLMLEGKIEMNLYEQKNIQYQKELSDLNTQFSNINLDIPNITDFIADCMSDINDISSLWSNFNYDDQKLLFKILFKELPEIIKESQSIGRTVLNEIFVRKSA